MTGRKGKGLSVTRGNNINVRRSQSQSEFGAGSWFGCKEKFDLFQDRASFKDRQWNGESSGRKSPDDVRRNWFIANMLASRTPFGRRRSSSSHLQNPVKSRLKLLHNMMVPLVFSSKWLFPTQQITDRINWPFRLTTKFRLIISPSHQGPLWPSIVLPPAHSHLEHDGKKLILSNSLLRIYTKENLIRWKTIRSSGNWKENWLWWWWSSCCTDGSMILWEWEKAWP